MRSLICSVLLGVCLLGSSVAYAQPEDSSVSAVPLYNMPAGHTCEVNGEWFRCFDLDDYVTLLRMDQDLHFYRLELVNAQEIIASLERVSSQLNLAIDGYEEQVFTLQRERDRLLRRWTSENRLRLEAENRPQIGSYVAWGLAAAEAAVLGALIIAMIAGG